MIARNGPWTAVALTVAKTVAEIGGAAQQNQAAQERSAFERNYFQAMAVQEQTALERDVDAARRERNATLARARAISAGQGGDVDNDYISMIAGQYGLHENQMIQDSQNRQTLLRARGQWSAHQADRTREASLLKIATSLGVGGLSLYDKWPADTNSPTASRPWYADRGPFGGPNAPRPD